MYPQYDIIVDHLWAIGRLSVCVVCTVSTQVEMETVLILSNSADKTQMSSYKGLAKINEPT